jgi:hypothetical protein
VVRDIAKTAIASNRFLGSKEIPSRKDFKVEEGEEAEN